MVRSSVETGVWLDLIVSRMAEKIPQLEYVESKFWCTFQNPLTHRNIIYLQPSKKQIRLHMRLPLSFDAVLEETSASKQWVKTCPSLFRVTSKLDVEKAVSLIVDSYNFDLSLK